MLDKLFATIIPVAFTSNVAFVTRLKKNKDASLETSVCFLTVVTMEKSLSMLLILRTENCTGQDIYHSCLFFKIRSNLICFKRQTYTAKLIGLLLRMRQKLQVSYILSKCEVGVYIIASGSAARGL